MDKGTGEQLIVIVLVLTICVSTLRFSRGRTRGERLHPPFLSITFIILRQHLDKGTGKQLMVILVLMICVFSLRLRKGRRRGERLITVFL